MNYLKLLMLAFGAASASAAIGTAAAQAELAREPALLCLENCVSTLTAKFKGTTSSIATLAGRQFEASGATYEVKTCKQLTTSEKDTAFCEAVLTFTGWKTGTTACRSETQDEKEKDASGTVLLALKVQFANGETVAKVLQPLVLFKVLGEKSGEAAEELVLNCGGIKEKVRGALSCSLVPGLVNIPTTSEAEVKCSQGATSHDPESVKCELLCQWLSEHPFEYSLGAGFEDAGLNLIVAGRFNKDIFLDD